MREQEQRKQNGDWHFENTALLFFETVLTYCVVCMYYLGVFCVQ
jgi:hypothetical protein